MKEEYTSRDYHTARLHGSYKNAAAIAMWLAENSSGPKEADEWLDCAARMQEKEDSKQYYHGIVLHRAQVRLVL